MATSCGSVQRNSTNSPVPRRDPGNISPDCAADRSPIDHNIADFRPVGAAMTPTRLLVVVLGISLAVAGGSIAAQQQRGAPAPPAAADRVLAQTVAAANAFLGQLGPEQRAKAAYPFDSPQRKNWSNLPTGIFQRNSLRMGDMTGPQRDTE